MLSWWIGGSLFLSLVSLQAPLFAAGRERTSGAIVALALLPLVAVLALMVWRPV